MISDRVRSFGSSDARMLFILPPSARNREFITVAEQPAKKDAKVYFYM